MTKKVAITVPEHCRVWSSTISGQVIINFEVLVEGEKPGDQAAQMHFALHPFEALSIGRLIQDESIQLLLSLAGYEELTGKSTASNERH